MHTPTLLIAFSRVGGAPRKSLCKKLLGYPHPHNAFLARCVRKVLSKRLLDYPHPFAPFRVVCGGARVPLRPKRYFPHYVGKNVEKRSVV
jgi:hypothetical protein